jgi:hypothetical protein
MFQLNQLKSALSCIGKYVKKMELYQPIQSLEGLQLMPNIQSLTLKGINDKKVFVLDFVCISQNCASLKS